MKNAYSSRTRKPPGPEQLRELFAYILRAYAFRNGTVILRDPVPINISAAVLKKCMI